MKNKIKICLFVFFIVSNFCYALPFTHYTSDFLRLRKDENLKSEIITVLEPNLGIEIIEKGKNETIDGIAADWVKVKCANGYIGWCFSGYLNPIENDVANTLSKEVAKIEAGAYPKQNNSSDQLKNITSLKEIIGKDGYYIQQQSRRFQGHGRAPEILQLSIINNKVFVREIDIVKNKTITLKEIEFVYNGTTFVHDKSKLKLDEQINLFCKFGENFLKSIPKIFFYRVKNFLELNKHILKKEDNRKLLEIFISNDTFYKDVFEMMSNFGLELDKNMLHRRIELYLEENENQKIIEILKDKNYIGLYDNEYLMMLFKHKNFFDGIEVLSELTNQRYELLSIYIQKKDYEKIINLCNEYGNSERSFWGISLNFFVDKSVREGMDEKEIETINEYLQKFLEAILTKKAILPMNVLDIINEKNNEIPLDILRNFIDKSLEYEIEPLKEKVANFDGCNNQLKIVNNKITEIQTQASSFKLSKCEQCFMGITFPAICFRCGHCYHSMCLNANDDNDLDDVDCPKCEEKKEIVKQQMLEMKSIYEDVNSKEKLKEALDNAEDKFQYVHNLYGRGIINIGPAYNDYTTKDIKDALALVEDSK